MPAFTKRWKETIELNLVEGKKVISILWNTDSFITSSNDSKFSLISLLRNVENYEVGKYWKGVERNYFFLLFQSAESTRTDPFTVMFAMFAWTKDWKENTSADRILDTTSVVFVWR